MKTLYLDCFSGISGDMFLGALLDLGIVSATTFEAELSKLGLNEITVNISKISKNAIAATDVDIVAQEHEHHDHHHDHDSHHGRTMREIEKIINNSALSGRVKDTAKGIFMRLAHAEAHIHNKDVYDVHFHEVGAVDSIADIVGAAVLLELLGVERVVCSELAEGYGFVHCQHGLIPIPVPATAHLLAQVGAKLRKIEVESELITPTGSAIVAELTDEFGPMPVFAGAKIGYGAGKKNFKHPNLLRVVFGEADQHRNEVTIIEANLDDITGENAGYVMEKLFGAGALDVYYTPIHMKKNRPAILLGVICNHDDIELLQDVILRQTTTIGLRFYKADRIVMERCIKQIDTAYGRVGVKVCRYRDIVKCMPEYEDVKRICDEKAVSFDRVYGAAKEGCLKVEAGDFE